MPESWSKHCPRCRYELPKWNARCPECGLPPPGKDRGWRYDGEFDLVRLLARRSFPPIVLCAFILAVSFAIRNWGAKVVDLGPALLLVLATVAIACIVVVRFAIGGVLRDARSESQGHVMRREQIAVLWASVCLLVCGGTVWWLLLVVTFTANP